MRIIRATSDKAVFNFVVPLHSQPSFHNMQFLSQQLVLISSFDRFALMISVEIFWGKDVKVNLQLFQRSALFAFKRGQTEQGKCWLGGCATFFFFFELKETQTGLDLIVLFGKGSRLLLACLCKPI